jgi:IclR family transcriptional regulator, pca regulon regulatory protein
MPAEGMAGLAKGLAVLEAFSHEVPKLTISDAARATGLSRAAARRCLMTLVELGYLAFDEKFFTPTPRVLRLGALYGETAHLPQLAQPHLVAVREAMDESVSLAVMDHDESLFVARSEVSRIFKIGVRVGARLPLYASATGHMLLAGLSAHELDAYLKRADLVARTPNTPATPEAVRQRVDAARAGGLAITNEDLEAGLLSIAVPVKDATGRTVATMSVSTSTARTSPDDLEARFAPALKHHAELLGRQL